jgi:hypothetical protein
MGVYPVELTAMYDPAMGDIIVEITNTLDEDMNNESIGLGDVIIQTNGARSMAPVPCESTAADLAGSWSHEGC